MIEKENAYNPLSIWRHFIMIITETDVTYAVT